MVRTVRVISKRIVTVRRVDHEANILIHIQPFTSQNTIARDNHTNMQNHIIPKKSKKLDYFTQRKLSQSIDRANMWGIYNILAIGEWPVLFLVKRELAIVKNV